MTNITSTLSTRKLLLLPTNHHSLTVWSPSLIPFIFLNFTATWCHSSGIWLTSWTCANAIYFFLCIQKKMIPRWLELFEKLLGNRLLRNRATNQHLPNIPTLPVHSSEVFACRRWLMPMKDPEHRGGLLWGASQHLWAEGYSMTEIMQPSPMEDFLGMLFDLCREYQQEIPPH